MTVQEFMEIQPGDIMVNDLSFTYHYIVINKRFPTSPNAYLNLDVFCIEDNKIIRNVSWDSFLVEKYRII